MKTQEDYLIIGGRRHGETIYVKGGVQGSITKLDDGEPYEVMWLWNGAPYGISGRTVDRDCLAFLTPYQGHNDALSAIELVQQAMVLAQGRSMPTEEKLSAVGGNIKKLASVFENHSSSDLVVNMDHAVDEAGVATVTVTVSDKKNAQPLYAAGRRLVLSELEGKDPSPGVDPEFERRFNKEYRDENVGHVETSIERRAAWWGWRARERGMVKKVAPSTPGLAAWEVNEALVKALGVPLDRCRDVTLKLVANEAPIVHASYWIDDPKPVQLAMKRFRLVAVEDGTELANRAADDARVTHDILVANQFKEIVTKLAKIGQVRIEFEHGDPKALEPVLSRGRWRASLAVTEPPIPGGRVRAWTYADDSLANALLYVFNCAWNVRSAFAHVLEPLENNP